MKTIKVVMVFTLLLASFIAFAGDTCSTVESCVKKISTMTNKPYFWSNNIRLQEKINNGPNFKITAKNADSFISRILFSNGYTRIKYNDGYEIISTRDIRYNATPLITVKELGAKSDSNDYVMVTIPINHEFQVSTIPRSIRPFMSRYGRVIGDTEGKQIILQESVNNAKRIVKLIGKMERKYSAAELKRLNKKYGKIEKLKLKIKQLEQNNKS